MSDWLTALSPLVIAHRGASADAPENSFSAFALAVEQGADGLEVDVQLSVDGWPIIMHDLTVDRTTNGSGPVVRLTVEQLQALDAGDGHPVPTLDQLFEMFGPTLLYNVELKNRGWFDEGLEAAVADRVERYHLQDRVLVSSFSPFTLRRCRQRLSQIAPTALIRSDGYRKFTYLLAGGRADHPQDTLVDEAYMAWARQRGYRIHVWTVDDPVRAQSLAKMGVHGIITNKPQFIRDSLY